MAPLSSTCSYLELRIRSKCGFFSGAIRKRKREPMEKNNAIVMPYFVCRKYLRILYSCGSFKLLACCPPHMHLYICTQLRHSSLFPKFSMPTPLQLRVLLSAMWNTQYARKFGKLSSGYRTGKGQFSFQSLKKAMPNNAQTTTQMYSSHTKQSNAQNSLSHTSTICEPWTSRCSSWF